MLLARERLPLEADLEVAEACPAGPLVGVEMDQLARYRVVIPNRGDNRGQFLVDLSSNIPAPAG